MNVPCERLSYIFSDQLHFASCSDGQVVTMDRITGIKEVLIDIISDENQSFSRLVYICNVE